MGINLGDIAPQPQVIPDGTLSLNLNKGISLDLSKSLPTLEKLKIGLGWDPSEGKTMDLDVFALALHNGKVLSGNDVIYFNQKDSVPGIRLSGDNKTGVGDGDDESIEITLAQVPVDVTEIALFVNIFEADKNNQNFGMVKNSYCRMVDQVTNKEEAIYILNESDAALYDAFHFVTLERNDTSWSFKTVGKGMHGDVTAIANQFL